MNNAALVAQAILFTAELMQRLIAIWSSGPKLSAEELARELDRINKFRDEMNKIDPFV